tara:strand:- start:819 stop:1175 length:357 start_codon:yes stop_codon:yes gene_type:complete
LSLLLNAGNLVEMAARGVGRAGARRGERDGGGASRRGGARGVSARTVELGVLHRLQALALLLIGEELAGGHLPLASLVGVLLPVRDHPARLPVAGEVLLQVDLGGGADPGECEHDEGV